MVDRELRCDQDRRGQRRELSAVVRRREERDDDRERRRRGEHESLDAVEAVDLAPDRERALAVELALDRPLVEGGEAGVDRRVDEEERDRERGAAPAIATGRSGPGRQPSRRSDRPRLPTA